MTFNSRYSKHNFKSFDISSSEAVVVCGPGGISNERIKLCRICAANGYPHEPIIFHKIPGKVLSNGLVEIARFEVYDYFRPYQKHEHKHKPQNFKQRKNTN